MHHRILSRQLQREFGNLVLSDERWNSFLHVISNYYYETDRERALLENALSVNNDELNAANMQLRAKAEQEKALLHSFTNSFPDLFFAKSLDGKYTGCNKSFELSIACTEMEIIGKTDAQLLDAARAQSTREIEMTVLETQEPITVRELVVDSKKNERVLEITRAPYYGMNGELLGLIGIGRDITKKKQDEDKVYYHANYDMKTGLPNGRMLQDKLEHEMRQTDRARCSLGLLMIDLDRFKEINDTHGHDAGNNTLVETARRISACTRESDIVARMHEGGDEFAVIVSHVTDPKHVEIVAQKIIEKLSKPFQLENSVGHVSGSVGIAIYPQDANDVKELINNADQAMYVAKKKGGNRYSHFTQSLQDSAQERSRMICDVRAAISENQFHLHYQPIVDMSSGRMQMAEALLRWDHPTRGTLLPSEFIPVAEENGLIVQIGNWVFREATKWAGKWNAQQPGFQVCLNASSMQFRGEGAASQLKWIEYLKTQNIPGKSIVIEIAESVLLNADNDVLQMLAHLRAASIQVAIDDFGTGPTSLTNLNKCEIEYLKIDKSVIQALSHEKTVKLCETIIVMGHKLGLQIIAEGVENPMQSEILDKASCNLAQGYFYQRPIVAEQLDAILRYGGMGR